MGNKSSQGQNHQDKFKKLFEKSYDQNELKFRLLEIAKLQLSEESIIASLLPEDFIKFLDSNKEYVKDLLSFIIDWMLNIVSKKQIFSEEENNLILFFLKFLARIMPIIYEVH